MAPVQTLAALLTLSLAAQICGASEREERGIFNLDSGEMCVGTDRVSNGICLTRTECGRQGGKVVGYCGVFSTCCGLQTCDIVTRAKDALFSNPPLTSLSSGLECSYNVEINNPRVCQIRIDLDIFTLSQPTLDSMGPLPIRSGGSRDVEKAPQASESTPTVPEGSPQDEQPERGNRTARQKIVGAFSYVCRDDTFQVTNLQAFSETIPPLCGENSGQHLYVRVNSSLNSRALRINFKIADRQLRNDLSQPSWRIRIQQLECYNTRGLQKKPTVLEVLTANYPVRPFLGYPSQILGRSEPPAERESRDKRFEVTSAMDEYLIAPPGCLQYFPDRSGAFESFNYNRGKGPYLGNLRYATCFRRSTDVCGIKYTPSLFQMASSTTLLSLNQFLDTDCERNPYVVNSAVSTDYLFIPDGQTVDGRRGSKWCGNSAANSIIASFPPGPLLVYFNSDNVAPVTTAEVGYRINYNVLNNCG